MSLWPAKAVRCPSVTLTLRSAVNVIVSVSVTVLLVRLGSVTPSGAVTVTVSESVPLADALTVPVAV